MTCDDSFWWLPHRLGLILLPGEIRGRVAFQSIQDSRFFHDRVLPFLSAPDRYFWLRVPSTLSIARLAARRPQWTSRRRRFRQRRLSHCQRNGTSDPPDSAAGRIGWRPLPDGISTSFDHDVGSTPASD